MPMPAHAQNAFDLVRKSRVVDDGRLDGFVRDLSEAELSALTPAALFARLLEAGVLTPYQANRLAAGRWEGFRVGGYVIQDFLGRGGTGEVYLAVHALLGKRVAVKVLSGAADADPAARGRFVREARAAASLDHPNIVHVFDVDVEHDPPFLVMEYVDGKSLQAAVAGHGPFSPAEAAFVGVEVARGLEPVAAVGLVHRDIKPANLLIDRKGAVKILDLGIARFTSEVNTRPTAHAEIVGTLDYLAPEQAVDSSAVDPRADLYALGATLYFLLAGHPPFTDTDISRKLERKQFSDPPPLHEFRPYIHEELSRIVQRLLARNPAHRYATPDDAARALEEWATPGPEFPARFFGPRTTIVAEVPGEPTDFGNDHDPTPMPDTRCIRRPKGTGGTSSIPSSPRLPEPIVSNAFVSGESKVMHAVDLGLQTVRLTRPPNPPSGFMQLRRTTRSRATKLLASAIRLVKRVLSWRRKRG